MKLYSLTCSALLLAQLAQVALQEEQVPEFLCSDKSCYAVCWIPRRYARSQGACREKNGDLMTVKTEVQREVISRLMDKMQKEDARVWIGLEPRTQCTDLQQPMRGFTWVTGDSDTDYTNWRNDGQKCDASPLCVTVRKDGTWEETKCDSKADGYLCEISHSLHCSSLTLPSSYSVTYYHPDLGIGHSGGSVFSNGTIAAISTSPDITQLSCKDKGDGTLSWGKETPGAWSCDIENGGCEGDCVEVSGTAECKCPPGSELRADLRGCTKPLDPKPCDPNPCSQLCNPDASPPGFYCMCTEGYKLAADGRTCEDIDDCAVNPNICEHHCTNTIGAFVCDCNPGYKIENGTDCQDIDECETNVCEHDCENSPGSYRCVCNEGYAIDKNDPKKCKKICNAAECEPDCSDPGKDCKCSDGYIFEQKDNGDYVCTDVDECDVAHCDGLLLCVNTFGSFICTLTPPTGEPPTIPSGTSPTIPTGTPPKIPPGEPTTIPPKEPTTIPPEEPTTIPTMTRPEDLYSLQDTIVWGICCGILSIFIVLIVMLCHRVRRHYIYHHDLNYNYYKNTDKDVVLKKIMVEPQW